MHVQLIDYTGIGNPDPDHAINVLLFTKQTRLQMSPGLFAEIANWPPEKKFEELEYISNTIPSSWEFIHYTWLIEGVTRAFTHQFVRSRQFSFAQQTMRVLDVSTGPGWSHLAGPSLQGESLMIYKNMMKNIDDAYKLLISKGAKIEDARGILPTNILTNIVGSCNMRTFVELVQKRSSPRTQSEYREVLDDMKASVLDVHPWMSLFLDLTFDQATTDLDKEISEIEDVTKRTRMIKLVDQLRAKQ